MFEMLNDPAIWASFATLVTLEIILGIDNIIFISLIANRLPPKKRRRARILGLSGALGLRIGLLAAAAWVVQLTDPVFRVYDAQFSWRDVILCAGGLFLLYKATSEIHDEVAGPRGRPRRRGEIGFTIAVFQIMALDLLFSFDSVITAVGIAENFPVMVAAVVTAILVMMLASETIARFIDKNPSTKMLALAFLVMVGVTLLADGAGYDVERGFIYAAMLFSAFVEVLNVMRTRRRRRRRMRMRALRREQAARAAEEKSARAPA